MIKVAKECAATYEAKAFVFHKTHKRWLMGRSICLFWLIYPLNWIFPTSPKSLNLSFPYLVASRPRNTLNTSWPSVSLQTNTDAHTYTPHILTLEFKKSEPPHVFNKTFSTPTFGPSFPCFPCSPMIPSKPYGDIGDRHQTPLSKVLWDRCHTANEQCQQKWIESRHHDKSIHLISEIWAQCVEHCWVSIMTVPLTWDPGAPGVPGDPAVPSSPDGPLRPLNPFLPGGPGEPCMQTGFVVIDRWLWCNWLIGWSMPVWMIGWFVGLLIYFPPITGSIAFKVSSAVYMVTEELDRKWCNSLCLL